MKILLKIALCLAIFSQFCLALDDFTTDKRYPIYQILVREIKDYTRNGMLAEGRVHIDLWPEYRDGITSAEKSEDYDLFAERMEQYIESIKSFEADRYNCDLQHITFDKHVDVYETEASKQWSLFDKFKLEMIKNSEADKKLVFAILENLETQLTVAIENFVESLNDVEKDQHKAFLIVCDSFVAESNKLLKHKQFVKLVEEFIDVYMKDDCLTKAFVDFVLQVYMYLEK